MENLKTDFNHVPFGVNLLLTLALLFQSFIVFLFSREDLTKGKHHISTLPFIGDHGIVEFTVGIASVIAAVILFVWLLRQVWNRVLSIRIGVQPISLSEAYAISILFFATTSWL